MNKNNKIPSKIYEKFKEQKINEKEVIEAIISVLEKSDSKFITIDGLDILKELKVKSSRIFKIIEGYLISDEEWEVRIKAIQVLSNLFPEKCLNPLKWAIRHELYPIVFREITNSIEHLKKEVQTAIIDEIIKKYAIFYDIIQSEAKFVFDLDCLDPFDHHGNPFKLEERLKKETVVHSIKRIYCYFNRFYAINNNHIIGLNIRRKVKKIPDSIRDLKKLRHLYIDTNIKIEIPKSIALLPRLRDLIVYSNEPIKLPIKIREKARNYFKRKYIWDGVSLDDALTLASLDIIGWGLNNVKNEELYKENPTWYFMGDIDVYHYKLDNQGHVIAVYIMTWEGRRVSFFPEDICSLKHLQELYLWGDNIEAIPESIVNLKSLRTLHISNRNGPPPKIPKSAISFLKSLNRSVIDGN